MTYSLATTNNSNPAPLVQRSMVVISPHNGHSGVMAVSGSVKRDCNQHAEVFV
jgi:hypothetical protein